MNSLIKAWAASPSPRIAVVGPGAVGTLYSIRLHRSGVPTLLVDYKPERATELTTKGFQVLEGDSEIGAGSKEGNAMVPITADLSALALDSPSTLFVLILVKAYQTLDVARSLLPHLRNPGSTCLVTLQNGLGNIEAIKEAIGASAQPAWKGRILAGTTSQGARIEGLGIVRDTGVGMNFVGPVDDDGGPGTGSVLVAELERMFQAAGLPFTASSTASSTLTAIFNKATINAALNPIAAVTRLPNGIAGKPGCETLEIMTQIAVECATIATAHGIKDLPLEHAHWNARLESVCKATAPNTNSMLMDILKKRKTEIGEINGAFLRLAKEKNIAAPMNGTFAGLIRTMETEYAKRVAE